jgi:hypothetical protein
MGSYRVMKVNFISLKRVGISPLAPCKTGLGVRPFLTLYLSNHGQ